MFESVSGFFSAWRAVLHISEWTGLSLGALAAIAAVVWYDPRLLKPAIGVAVLVAVGYAGVLYGDKTGRADVEAQWADARKAAIAAEKERDAMIQQNLEAKYQPVLANLERQAEERKARSDGYERKILAMLARPSSPRCELGDAALRVRR